jgi:DNA-directed RNA polymerase specialized sigma24 family protein
MSPSDDDPPPSDSSPSLRDSRGPISETDARLPLRDAPMSETGARVSLRDGLLNEKDARVKLRRAPVSETDTRLSLRDARMNETDARVKLRDAPVSENDARLRLRDAPVSETDARLSLRDAPVNETDTRLSLRDGPVSETNERLSLRDAPIHDTVPPLAKVIPLHDVSPEAVRAFLARAETRRMVISLVARKVPRANVEDVAHDAFEEATKALKRQPPHRGETLPGWLATITRRVIADFHVKRTRRGKYEGPMPEEPEQSEWIDGGSAAALPQRGPEPSYDPRVASEDDSEVDAWLVRRWLEGQVAGHPRDQETFAILLEHARGSKTYQEIARERDMTLTALSSRIFEFKGKYIPRYQRWRNRAVLLVLLGGAAVIAAVVVLWLLLRPAAIGPDPMWAPPPKRPTPSATAPAPEPFEPALPTNRPAPRDGKPK